MLKYNNDSIGNEGINPSSAPEVDTEIFANDENDDGIDCDKKSNNMWLVQNGKHVNLIHNQDPWYLNKNYTHVPIIDNFSHQDSKISSIPTNADEEINNIPNKFIDIANSRRILSHNADSTMNSNSINKYIPYGLLYLLIFFAVLLLIYKLGTRND